MISTVSWLDLRAFVAVALALGCFLVFMAVAVYISHEVRSDPNWRNRMGNRAALGIMLFMFGEALNRGWGAVLTVAFTQGYDIGLIESRYPVAFAGAVICFIGILAKLRIFTPDNWGDALWVYGGLFCVGTAALAVWV
jgi:hypothetical protein